MAGVKIVGRWTFYSVENRISNTVVDRYAIVDGWRPLIAAIDNGSREVVGFRFDRRGRVIEAADALEQGIIYRYGSKEAVPQAA
jgi:hypothetical protein